jgi:dipeptidyl aminopeptidase/acylaminoacyl peptidase
MRAVTDFALDAALALATELVDAWGCWAPTLMPDASAVAFVSDRRGTPELWVQSLGTGRDARVLPFTDDPVLAVHWSPDGEWLACAVATGGGVRTQVWVIRPDGTDARRVAGSADEHATLGPWLRRGHRLVVGIAAPALFEPTRSDIVDPATGVHEALAVGDLIDVLDLSNDERFVLLRDGRRGEQFCVMVDLVNDADHPLLPYPHTGATDRGLLRAAPAGESSPMMVYLVTDAGRPRRELVAVPVAEDGQRAQVGVLASRPDAELELLDADQAGRLLVLVWNVAGASEVELLDTATGTRRMVPGLAGAVVSGCVLSRDGLSLVLCVEGPATPRSLWRYGTDDGSLARIDAAGPVSHSLVVPTLETFSSHDGLELTGWLYRVPGRVDPGPTMLSLHGGPEAQERPVFTPQHQVMVAAGIAVFAPNVRGSSGFGRSFVHADDRYGRYDAIADVAACADYLVSEGVAAPGRIAVTGRSYGGYLTLSALVSYPDVFCAGVDICGMSDLLSFYRDTEPWIAEAATSKYGDPLHDRVLLQELSPLRYCDRIQAALLVAHGELDTNVPLGEALQIVSALRAAGREVEYLQLNGEGHEFRRADSRRQLLDRMTRFLVTQLSSEG